MADDADFYFRPQLLERVDVVAFDPRGTGDSDPVDCLSDRDLDTFISQDPSPDSPEEARELTADQDAFFRGCVALSDDVVGHVSTVESARDMDVLRGALREEQLSYLGFSYGTTLGSVYAQLFPDERRPVRARRRHRPEPRLAAELVEPGPRLPDRARCLHPELHRRGSVLPRRHHRRGS